ncbi:MAG TPA: chorismate synthase, partial [Candidatus Agathobaculum merdigallinarum]|nr:chorismate synthase [Candidatus Agathobaculum merdigallinarum]
MGSTWGNAIKISVFGESHGTGIGVVIDGFPSGVAYDEAFVLREMERRAPGRNKQSTQRKEADLPVIQSGIYNGKTTGTPICALIQNTNQRSGDYSELAAQPRPGHADYTGMVRYKSCNDPRGGGHFSGRLTAPLVFAGAMCKLWLKT